MKQLIVRLIIVVITFIIAVTAAALWLMYRSSNNEKSAVETIRSEAPATCCELMQNPDRYYSKTIRIQAVLLGYHELALYDPACKGVDKYIRADFDSASRKKLVEGIANLNGAGSKEGNFWADVVLTGRFEKVKEGDSNDNKTESLKVDHQYIKYRFRLVVLDVEQVRTLAPDMTWPP